MAGSHGNHKDSYHQCHNQRSMQRLKNLANHNKCKQGRNRDFQGIYRLNHSYFSYSKRLEVYYCCQKYDERCTKEHQKTVIACENKAVNFPVHERRQCHGTESSYYEQRLPVSQFANRTLYKKVAEAPANKSTEREEHPNLKCHKTICFPV